MKNSHFIETYVIFIVFHCDFLDKSFDPVLTIAYGQYPICVDKMSIFHFSITKKIHEFLCPTNSKKHPQSP